MTRQKRKKRTTVARVGDAPTKERRQHNGGMVTEVIDRDADGKVLMKRYRAAWECPLDAYREHELIAEPEYQAGLRLRGAYHNAVLSKRATHERLNNYPTTTGLTMSEKIVKDAYRAIPSHNIETVMDVCAYDVHIWNPAALEKLRKGLGHLALQWHMMAIETCEWKKK